MPRIDQIQLGKLPKKADSRTLFLPGLLAGEKAPSGDQNNGQEVTIEWGELGNDKIGDCAIAAAGHAEMVWAALYDHEQFSPTCAQIIDDYSTITGYTRGKPETDKGADLLAVLKFWQSTGIAHRKIGAFAEIPSHDLSTIRWSIYTFGVAYVGFGLPTEFVCPKDRTQHVAFATKRSPWKPSTWQNVLNGHCVLYTGYSPTNFTCVSWGKPMEVSVAFHRHYCDEAYAIIPPERMGGAAQLDWEQLQKALDLAQAVDLT